MTPNQLIESFFHIVGQLIGQFGHLLLGALGLIVVSVLYLVLYFTLIGSLLFLVIYGLVRWIRKRKSMKKEAKR
ncbi:MULTISPECIES: hypothetical protein [Listeria]|uniref:hypothetical protein n=1 Tax=Listeria TaxID=1637 RepID=UPI000B58CA3B|nr:MULTISPECIES: hypothetical protein [Listeria]